MVLLRHFNDDIFGFHPSHRSRYHETHIRPIDLDRNRLVFVLLVHIPPLSHQLVSLTLTDAFAPQHTNGRVSLEDSSFLFFCLRQTCCHARFLSRSQTVARSQIVLPVRLFSLAAFHRRQTSLIEQRSCPDQPKTRRTTWASSVRMPLPGTRTPSPFCYIERWQEISIDVIVHNLVALRIALHFQLFFPSSKVWVVFC